MPHSDSFIRDTRLVGYVRIENRDDIYLTEQPAKIENFANKENMDVLHIEHEVSNGAQLMRLGLWKALRSIACLNCEPKNMPMADMYEYWFKEATKPCNCASPNQASGLIVEDIRVICTTPSQGAKFTLDMCMQRKHVYAVREKRCLSCCNPQAIEFIKKQMLGK